MRQLRVCEREQRERETEEESERGRRRTLLDLVEPAALLERRLALLEVRAVRLGADEAADDDPAGDNL